MSTISRGRNRSAQTSTSSGSAGPAATVSGAEAGFGDVLGGLQHPQDVAAGECLEIGISPAAIREFGQERRIAGDVLEAGRQAFGAVVVAAEPDMRDPGDLPGVLDMIGN